MGIQRTRQVFEFFAVVQLTQPSLRQAITPESSASDGSSDCSNRISITATIDR